MRPAIRTAGALALVLGLTLAPLPEAGGSEGEARWWIARFDHRITQADRDLLTGAGGSGLQYAPPDGYVLWLDADTADSLSERASFSPLPAALKVDPSLSRSRVARPLTISVHESGMGQLVEAVGSMFRVHGGFDSEGAVRDVFAFAPPAAAPAIALHPAVRYVGPAPAGLAPLDEVSDQIQAGNLSGGNVTPGYESWLQAKGLDGSGVRVSIVDTGVDAHPDFGNRIVDEVDYSPSPTGEPNDVGGHGTHVAGIVGGAASTLPAVGRVKDTGGFLYGLGVAPKVEMVNQNAIGSTAVPVCTTSVWPPTYPWDRLTRDALSMGAHVWNASWWSCEDAVGNYIQTSAKFDELARDADPSTPGAQPFTFVFSAGNNGPGGTSVAAPASSKNVISVGATQNRRGGGNPASMAGFSSRGPAQDGRLLPTISAPGEGIVSTRSFAGQACALPVQDSFGLYSSCSGTSMAAPHVTGAVALLTQWWRRSNTSDPSPAMTKALLVNTATDMGAKNIPNNNEGWGRVNLGSLFDSSTRVYEDQGTILSSPGSSATYRIVPADPSQPVKVSLAWTDAPGAPGSEPTLVNDLDLTVTSEGGATFLGNVFEAGMSFAGGEADRLNNVENVFVPSGSGVFTVQVRAENLPGDGVPFSGDETDQDFALVLSNAVLV